ncbi:MAG: Ig-like domain-containing protein, partial [Chloroflexia bacterium]
MKNWSKDRRGQAWRLLSFVLIAMMVLGLVSWSGQSRFTEAGTSPAVEMASAPQAAVPVVPARVAYNEPVGALSLPGAPLAPAITASLTDALTVDNDNDTQADPGDTLQYTAVITNRGSDATDVDYSEPLDPLTSLVAGSVNVSPLAFDDAYTTVGNTLLAVGVAPPANTPAVQTAGNLFSNDTEFLGDTFSLSTFQATSANGGTVSVNPSGTFTFLPAANFVGTDTFTYTLIDSGGLTGVGVVTVNVVNRVWYVNNALGVNGDGRSTSPFNTLTNVNSATGAGDADSPNDYIYIFTGSTPYVGGLPLEAGQTLIGQGVALVVSSFTLHPAGSRPALSNPGGNIITLATNNTIRGLNTGDTTGIDIVGTSFGTLTVSDVAIQGTGRALSLTTGTLSVGLDSIQSTSSTGGQGILLSSVGGTMNVAGTTNITNPSSQGISVQTSTANVSFGNTTVSGSGNTGVELATNSGAITFGSLSITPDSGFRGLHATGNTGALTSSGGTIATTTNVAVEIVGTSAANRTPLNMQFVSVSANGGTNGIVLTNTSSTGSPGGFRVNGSGSTLASGGTLQAGSGNGIQLTDVVNVFFNFMDVKNYANNGVLGTRVSGFNMTSGRVQNNTNAVGEAGILLNDVLGTNNVSSTEVNGSTEDNVRVFNTSTTGTFTWTGGSVHDNSTASGNFGIDLQTSTTGNLTGVVSGTLLYGNRTIALRADAADGSTLSATFTNNTIRAGSPNQGNQGIEVTRAVTANVTFAVEGNKVGT